MAMRYSLLGWTRRWRATTERYRRVHANGLPRVHVEDRVQVTVLLVQQHAQTPRQHNRGLAIVVHLVDGLEVLDRGCTRDGNPRAQKHDGDSE